MIIFLALICRRFPVMGLHTRTDVVRLLSVSFLVYA